jgi:hypothetical protein
MPSRTFLLRSLKARRATGVALALAAVSFAVAPRAASAAQVYSNDFQAAAGPEWSETSISSTPVPADGSRMFLGRLNNGTVTLTLDGLTAHSTVTIDFDLYVIGTWDGISSYPYGPDRWTLGVEGGPILLDTSFSNVTSPPFGIPFAQNYPAAWQTGVYGQFTGASEARTLGYIFSGWDVSAVYHLSYTFPSSTSSIVFDFTAAMGQEYGGPHNMDEECWGLDNVSVSTDAVASVPSASAQSRGGVVFSPNPCRTTCDVIMDRLTAETATAVAIHDLSGRLVERRPVSPNAIGARFSLAGVKPGVYFASVEGRGGARLALGRIAVVR